MKKTYILTTVLMIITFGAISLNARQIEERIFDYPVSAKYEQKKLAQNKSGNITYIDIGISQPNVEDCFESFIPSELSLEDEIKIYPNPNLGIFTLEINTKNYGKSFDISIFNLTGQKIHEYSVIDFSSGYSKELDLRYLKSGTYFIKVQSKDNTDFAQVKKIIVK